MANADALALARAHIVRLEEALAEYVLRYGYTDRARAVLREAAQADGLASWPRRPGPET